MTNTTTTAVPSVGAHRPIGSRVGDAVLAVAVTGFAVVALAFGQGDDGVATGSSYVVAVVSGGALVVRRRCAVAVLAVVVIGRIVVIWDVGNDLALMPAAVVALYTVARHGGRTAGLITASVAALVMGVVSAALGDEAFPVELLGEVAVAFLPIAVGDAVRTRADRIRDLIDTEVETRVQAERLRIARDLHDVVAHGLSTIAVQSGVAAHLLERDPSQAREALEVINATGKASLEDLRAMVGVLRSTESAELNPTPSDPNDIGDLLVSAGHAGVNADAETTGAFPADVSDAVVVAVHRIVQEALTNVARHAGAVATTVRLDHDDDGVVVEVRNERPAARRSDVASTGVGIVGMQERAASVGGHLEAGPTPDGGFCVRAVVPYHRRST